MAGTAKGTSTELGKAMRGEKIEGRQAQNALGQAVNRLTNMTKRTDKTKEAIATTGSMVVHTAETQGTLFLASMAEGYLGSDKLKVGGLDLRAPVAVLAQGFGLYEAMSGKKGGGHSLALGNGLMGSWLASVAVSAGQTLRDKRGGAQPAANQPQVQQAQVVAVTPAMQGAPEMLALPAPSLIPEPSVRGPLREVLLTPAASDEPLYDSDDLTEESDFEGGPLRRGRKRGARGGPRGGRRGGPRRRSRFLRAEQDEDDDE